MARPAAGVGGCIVGNAQALRLPRQIGYQGQDRDACHHIADHECAVWASVPGGERRL